MLDTIEGRSVQVGACELVPIVRREARIQRRASVGSEGVVGRGGGVINIRPIAILVRGCGGDERRIRVADRTIQLIGGLLLTAFVIPLLMMVAVRVARRG